MKKIISKVLLGTLLAINILAVLSFAAEENKIVIIHTNDTHAAVTDDKQSQIGFAKLGTYVEQMRKRADNVLVLDAGDMFQGMPFANLEKGKSIIPIVNEIGYDAMTVGNHEYDFGAQNLKTLENQLNFPILATNIRKDGVLQFKPYIIKEISGTKIGIIGVATPETAYKTHPDNVKGYVFTDIIKETQKSVDKLKQEKVDIIIALTHLGLNEGDYTSDLLAKNIKEIDLIIDGHSHTTLEKGQTVENTLIASTGSKLNAVGKVEITLQNSKITQKEASLLKYENLSFLPPKKEIVDLINKEEQKQQTILNQVIGKTTVDLVGEREIVRTGESNLGQLATDAILNLTKADIAITNGGGIRASIPKGDITMGDMVTVFPFGNTIMVKDMKSEDIIAALEYGTIDYPTEKGAFPHVAGITFTLDSSKQGKERITDVKIQGNPIEKDKTYSVATNDFMAAGGDGYEMFKKYPIKAEYNTLMDALLNYIQEKGTIEGVLEQRINIITAKENQKAA